MLGELLFLKKLCISEEKSWKLNIDVVLNILEFKMKIKKQGLFQMWLNSVLFVVHQLAIHWYTFITGKQWIQYYTKSFTITYSSLWLQIIHRRQAVFGIVFQVSKGENIPRLPFVTFSSIWYEFSKVSTKETWPVFLTSWKVELIDTRA